MTSKQWHDIEIFCAHDLNGVEDHIATFRFIVGQDTYVGIGRNTDRVSLKGDVVQTFDDAYALPEDGDAYKAGPVRQRSDIRCRHKGCRVGPAIAKERNLQDSLARLNMHGQYRISLSAFKKVLEGRI